MELCATVSCGSLHHCGRGPGSSVCIDHGWCVRSESAGTNNRQWQSDIRDCNVFEAKRVGRRRSSDAGLFHSSSDRALERTGVVDGSGQRAPGLVRRALGRGGHFKRQRMGRGQLRHQALDRLVRTPAQFPFTQSPRRRHIRWSSIGTEFDGPWSTRRMARTSTAF